MIAELLPPLVIDTIDGIQVVRDDLLPGGTYQSLRSARCVVPERGGLGDRAASAFADLHDTAYPIARECAAGKDYRRMTQLNVAPRKCAGIPPLHLVVRVESNATAGPLHVSDTVADFGPHWKGMAVRDGG